MEVGREDLSLARLAEAHWDAVAILAEAGREPERGALYGVWASEKPGQALRLTQNGKQLTICGQKMFCSGAGLLDRALVTAGENLVDVDLREHVDAIDIDLTGWNTPAFAETQTAAVTFRCVPVAGGEPIGPPNWYLDRPGFWHGACGPAACWAGGAVRLVDYALAQTRRDPHTLAHLGAMEAAAWSLRSILETAGREIDEDPHDVTRARIRARTVRHLVEQAATDILRRLPRAYGPYPLAADAAIARHYAELDLYLRQWHAERDLEALGADLVEHH